ncbi:putative cytochrome b5 reductase [Aspergillus thermomutatus]|uniref:Cytochrome-b5 reductase n=1 Tax=Aspergillus thermomutatus TaxID=41047 RepID=A0A397HKN2_ASPTH|nr:uncharacterized protein CDV56_108798 [Aspergillus thermomutatus]RHZ63622.1 hypothetical protein CDV56_108798 [Aspergillus thermomutatus]
MPEFTVEDVAGHKTRDDLWVIIHGKVYDLTKYIRDHPGGADVLLDVAGTDATAAYEDVGHSEDADEIMQTYLVGTLKDATQFVRKSVVRVVQQTSQPVVESNPSSRVRKVAAASSAAGILSLLYYVSPRRGSSQLPLALRDIPAYLPGLHRLLPSAMTDMRLPHGGFVSGFAAAALLSTLIGGVVGIKLSKLTHIDSGFTRYPSRIKCQPRPKPEPHNIPGFLNPKDYKTLPLVEKELLAPNVYRFVFQLPGPTDIIGLPIGQHVSIKATVNGQSVSRSYTPTSNNLDRGRLELVIKCYPDGLLTGQYLANLQLGEKVQFRGPKGAMKYQRNLCRKIGMIAGGTGITPMYQLIRAICEDDRDTTEISLVYANRSEGDILLRAELEAFARKYPKQFQIYYMLDDPPKDWSYGTGYVTPDVMASRLPKPAADTKILLCGPPGMINAAKKGLVSLGFEAPGAVGRMTDQIFCF